MRICLEEDLEFFLGRGRKIGALSSSIIFGLIALLRLLVFEFAGVLFLEPFGRPRPRTLSRILEGRAVFVHADVRNGLRFDVLAQCVRGGRDPPHMRPDDGLRCCCCRCCARSPTARPTRIPTRCPTRFTARCLTRARRPSDGSGTPRPSADDELFGFSCRILRLRGLSTRRRSRFGFSR